MEWFIDLIEIVVGFVEWFIEFVGFVFWFVIFEIGLIDFEIWWTFVYTSVSCNQSLGNALINASYPPLPCVGM